MDAQQGRARDSHAVDIASLARQLREELATADTLPVQLAGGCPIIIGEVGGLTRNVDPAEYDPHHVSIGPYHRIRNPDLARDDEKIRSLGVVLSAASAGMTLEVYLDEMARLEGQARSCYAHTFSIESNEFVRMLLLDGCYLLARFGDVDSGRHRNGAPAANAHAKGGCQYHRSGAPLVSAPGGGDKLETISVVRDVFYLAENQIPFFVVNKIYQLTFLDSGVSAANAIACDVRELLRRQLYSVAAPAVAEPPGPGNLLHLLHMHLKPTVHLSPTGDKVTGKLVGRWRTATEYHFAGVKFKTRSLGSKEARCVLDVKLDSGGGVLEIPRLNIDAETWRLLRNLMALEQHNPDTAGSNVTAYCVFMSQVACTAIDVDLLSRRGVIAHGLGNHGEVARCFADLCKGIVFRADDPDGNYLMATCQALEKRFRSRPRRWMAWLRQKYFRNPWLAVGLAAAAVGLVCTVVQAVYSVLSYVQGAR
ncbi:uncharacterized protein LOC133896428 [Phragmites australis]|uniref:uncharacterized protein LOC133896428 n=1 Tax=Phragmites australis TaxID=29695 RepID=UPI002D76DC9E|nr:uncharacterized protein LOC133896428 [Phragmites australis]